MKHRLCQVEFGVGCLGDVKVLVKVWQQVLASEGLEGTMARFVLTVIEDRLPGEEVRLVFTAGQRVLSRFLSALTDAHFKYLCNDVIPGMLTECRPIRDLGLLKTMGSDDQREGAGEEN